MQKSGRVLRITLRGVLVLIVLIALPLGWHSAVRRNERSISLLLGRANRAETELRMLEWRQGSDRPALESQDLRSQSVLFQAKMQALNMQNVSISGPARAFRETHFQGSNFENASLRGGDSAFQLALFDDAVLINARLSGGVASFQGASFARADLSQAILRGQTASFQGASFAGAILIDAEIDCRGSSFQATNIDGAKFQGADLSTLDPASLESAYFRTSPTYDGRTRFPEGFDPVESRWSHVP